ncbi:MAG: thiol-disulfide oxidoreductase DCC family protein [Gaiellaceae bacterium]
MLIFDGDCGFCTSCANWIAARWRGDARAVPWQTLGEDELAARSLTREDVRAAVWWIDEDGRRSRAHVATARALIAGSGWTAALGRVLLVPPFRWIAAAIYPVVARWRHRLPGGTPVCRM